MKRLLLIQIDGLSSSTLDKALQKKLMPGIQKLLQHGYTKRTIFSGLPSTTPAAQFSLMYGVSDAVVGFRFLIKEARNLLFIPTLPESITFLENKYQGTRSLLQGGTTIFSLFKGQSQTSISFGEFHHSKRIIFPFIKYVGNPLHVLAFLAKVTALLMIDRLEEKRAGHQAGLIQKFIHITKRVTHEVAVSQLSSYLTQEAVNRGDPVIWVNFSGYDILAHTYTPDHLFSLYFLSIVDIYVRNIFRSIQKSGVEYEVMIYSDHGQSDSVPIKEQYGKSLGEAIQALFPHLRIVELPKISLHSHVPIQDADLCLFHSGGLSLAYLPRLKQKLESDELEKEIPGFADKVSHIPGVEFVMTRDKKPKIMYQNKVYFVTNKTRFIPSLSNNEHELLNNQLLKLIDAPFGADAYIFGRMLSGRKVISFEDQLGTHGGFGGGQTKAFVISKNIQFAETKIRDFADIHQVLMTFLENNASGQNHLSKV